MAQTSEQPPAGLEQAAEEAAFYHEAALNAAWTGTRLALGALSFGFGAFAFAFFYLRSLNSHGLWYPASLHHHHPQLWAGTVVMGLVVVSALLQTAGLQRIKAGHKGAWQRAALTAGFASVFVGFWPVYVFVVFAVMIWLETLIMRARPIPEISFVEQPPTYAEAFAVQRFQAALSSFTIVWNYLALVAIVAWVLFYLVH
jgi:hypothetical protein